MVAPEGRDYSGDSRPEDEVRVEDPGDKERLRHEALLLRQQTGGWDILSAALAVVVVEGIGALMYRASFPLFAKVRSLVTVFNYWKTGLTLGLFLDSFKYEIKDVFRFTNPFHEFDVFSIFA